jgi:hypothetical protein
MLTDCYPEENRSPRETLSSTPITYTIDFIEIVIERFPHHLFNLLRDMYGIDQYQRNTTGRQYYRRYFKVLSFNGTETDLHCWWYPRPLKFQDPHLSIPKFALFLVNKHNKLPTTLLSDTKFFVNKILRGGGIHGNDVYFSRIEISTLIGLNHEIVKKCLNVRYSRNVTLESQKNPYTIYFTERSNNNGRIFCYPQRDNDNNPLSNVTKIEFTITGRPRIRRLGIRSGEDIKSWNPVPMIRNRVEFIEPDFGRIAKRVSRTHERFLRRLYDRTYVSSWLRNRTVSKVLGPKRRDYLRKVSDLEQAYFGGLQSTYEIIKDAVI